MAIVAPQYMSQLNGIPRLVGTPDITCEPDRVEAGAYVVTLKTTEETVVVALEVLHLLLGLGERIKRTVKNTSSQERGMAQANQIHTNEQTMAQLYHDARARGFKHRVAVRIVAESDIAKRLGYDKAMIGQCVKAFPDLANTLTHQYKKELEHGE